MCFDKALANLGSSVNVMPYSTFTDLGLGKLAPTKFIIELADKTMKRPKGSAENVDFTKLNDLNEPLELNDHEMEDLDSEIEVGKIIDEPKVKEKSRKGQNRIKTEQKQEVWRSQEMLKAVTVDRARKTEENKKRMNENARTVKKLFKFKENKKRKGPFLPISQSCTNQGPPMQITSKS
nr:hypothetical protein [Tanacetum cinerariifolium]